MRARTWVAVAVTAGALAVPAWAGDAAFDPADVVFKNRHPVKCEQAARAVEAQDALNGWRVLWRCVEEGVWPDLEVLNTRPWSEHITTRKDGPLLLARLLALRGGHVEADLEKLKPVCSQVVTLGAALKKPKTAKGKVVIFRGTVEEPVEMEDGEYFQFAETSLVTEVTAKNKWEADRMKQGSGKYVGYDGRYYGSYNSYGYNGVRRGDADQNNKGRTGRVALIKQPKRVPNIQPNKEYLCAMAFQRVDGATVDQNNPSPDDAAVVGSFLACHTMATKVME